MTLLKMFFFESVPNGEIDVMKKKIKNTYDFVLEDKPFRREGGSKEGRDRKD